MFDPLNESERLKRQKGRLKRREGRRKHRKVIL